MHGTFIILLKYIVTASDKAIQKNKKIFKYKYISFLDNFLLFKKLI